MDLFTRLFFIIASLHNISPSTQQSFNLDLGKSASSNNANKRKEESLGVSDRNSLENSFAPTKVTTSTINSQTPSFPPNFQQSNLNKFQVEHRTKDQSRASSSVKNRIREGPPSITVTKSIVHGSINKNTSVILECFIDSYPASSNIWMNGDFETIKNTSGKYYITEDFIPNYEYRYRLRLHFKEITDEDLSQKFWCLSSNIYGNEKGQVRIQVSEHLVTTSIPKNGIINAKRRSDVELSCSVQGYPLPITYWFKGDTGYQIISNSKYIVLEEHGTDKFQYISRLQIKNINGREFSSYKCVTKNSFAESQHVFLVQELTSSKPYKSYSSSIHNVSYTRTFLFLSLIFSWSAF